MADQNRKVNFEIAAKTAAISSICVNLALVTVIAIILAISDVDFLSTVALALAVIAFIVQIVVFIQQTSASSMQLARSEELHGSTMRALAAIEEKAEGTRQTVTSISDQMLTAMLGKGFPPKQSADAAESAENAVLRAQRMEQMAATAHDIPASRDVPASQSNGDAEPPPPGWPTPFGERKSDATAALEALEPNELRSLQFLARDYQKYGNRPPDRIGHGVEGATIAKKLYRLGLAKRTRSSWDGGRNVVTVLTDKGKDAAALLLWEDFPGGVDQPVVEAREKLKRYNEYMETLQRQSEEELADIPVEG